ncbi:MFS transporter [Elusimicrobiota bacterium]
MRNILTPPNIVWSSFFVSTIGERLTFASLLILASRLNGPEIGATAIMVIYTLTFVLIAPFAGKIIDTYKHRKKDILIFSDLARALLVVAYVQVLFYGHHMVSNLAFYLSIIAVVAISGIARPGLWAFIPEIVPSSGVGKLNIRISVSGGIAMAIGTAAGGWLLMKISFGPIFAIDSLTYLVSALMLLTLAIPSSGSAGQEVRDETAPAFDLAFLRSVLKVRTLKEALLLACIINILIGFLNSYLVMSVERIFFLPQSYIAYGYSFWAIGGVASFWLYPMFAKLVRNNLLKGMYFLVLFAILASFPAVYLNNYYLFYSIIVVLGAVANISSAMVNTVCMADCDPTMRGRFASLLSLIVRISMLGGLLMAPFAVSRQYIFAIYAFLAIGLLCFSCLKSVAWTQDYEEFAG